MTTMTGQVLEDLANELYAIGVWSSVIAAGVGLIRLLRPLHDQRRRARVIGAKSYRRDHDQASVFGMVGRCASEAGDRRTECTHRRKLPKASTAHRGG